MQGSLDALAVCDNVTKTEKNQSFTSFAFLNWTTQTFLWFWAGVCLFSVNDWQIEAKEKQFLVYSKYMEYLKNV